MKSTSSPSSKGVEALAGTPSTRTIIVGIIPPITGYLFRTALKRSPYLPGDGMTKYSWLAGTTCDIWKNRTLTLTDAEPKSPIGARAWPDVCPWITLDWEDRSEKVLVKDPDSSAATTPPAPTMANSRSSLRLDLSGCLELSFAEEPSAPSLSKPASLTGYHFYLASHPRMVGAVILVRARDGECHCIPGSGIQHA